MTKVWFYLVCLLFMSDGFCQSKKEIEYLTDKYFSGPYLIYDCEERHWVCVSEENFNECQSLRNDDSKKFESYIHSCSPFGHFPTIESCNQRILFLTTHQHGQRFCVKEEWRSKNISF